MAAQYRELTDSRDMLIDAVRRVVPRAELTATRSVVCRDMRHSFSPESPAKLCLSIWTPEA